MRLIGDFSCLRNMAIYSQLQEAVKLIIGRVAGRLSGTVGRSGLMDPAVTRLERAAVVANTPITFQPRELLGVRSETLFDIAHRF